MQPIQPLGPGGMQPIQPLGPGGLPPIQPLGPGGIQPIQPLGPGGIQPMPPIQPLGPGGIQPIQPLGPGGIQPIQPLGPGGTRCPLVSLLEYELKILSSTGFRDRINSTKRNHFKYSVLDKTTNMFPKFWRGMYKWNATML